MLLEELYRKYHDVNRETAVFDVAESFYPPLLVRPDSSWSTAKQRIAWIGQETLRDGWSADRAGPNLATLHDFFSRDDSVEAMIRAYCSVEGTLGEPNLPNGPYWRYIKESFGLLEKIDTVSMIATNLVLCAAQGESSKLWKVSANVKKPYLDWQHGLLSEELKALDPTLIIFVTGPDYDPYLGREFDGLTYESVPPYHERELAKLQHENLRAPAFRTYHPGHLALKEHLHFGPITAIMQATGIC